MEITIDKIKEKYLTLSKKIFEEPASFPYSTEPTNCGVDHIEIKDDNSIALVGTDRGVETQRRETYDLNELMYWMFSDISYGIGFQYELKHRHPTDDFRRIAFSKALESIAKISLEWRDRLKAEQDQILSRNPFRDNL